MDEVDSGVRHVVQDDVAHRERVDAARRQVGGDEDLGIGQRRPHEPPRPAGPPDAQLADLGGCRRGGRGRVGSGERGRGRVGPSEAVGREFRQDFCLALLGRVAVERHGIDALGLEIVGDFGRPFSFIHEHQDALQVGGIQLLARRAIAARLADAINGVCAGQVAVAHVRLFLDVDHAEHDPSRDRMEVGRDQAFQAREALAQRRVQGPGNGGRAEDELLQRGAAPVNDGHSGGSEGAVEQRVGLVYHQVADAAQDVGLGLGDGGDQVRRRHQHVDARRREDAPPDDVGRHGRGDAVGADLDGEGQGPEDGPHLADELGRGHQDDRARAPAGGVGRVVQRRGLHVVRVLLHLLPHVLLLEHAVLLLEGLSALDGVEDRQRVRQRLA